MSTPLDALVFDIETKGAKGLSDTLGIQEKIDALDDLELDELIQAAFDADIKIGNRNKRESIYPFLVAHYGKVIDQAALKLYGAEIYAIAFGGLNGGKVKAMAVTDEVDEAGVIRSFLAALEVNAPHLLVGFNIRGFDIPILRARCAFLSIPWPDWLPRTVKEDKFNETTVFDIRDVLDEGPLDTWLRVFGLPPKTAAGSDVANMSPREVAQYCADDVERERMLARRIMVNTKHHGMVDS